MIKIKSRLEIEKMRAAGKILAETFLALNEHIKPGITTYELDNIAKKYIKSNNALCSFKNYNGYPANICTSVNEQVVHGIPSKDVVLTDGDIISIDLGVLYQGFHADSAKTFAVGIITDEAQRLIDVTKESFYRGLANVTPDNRLLDISSAIQTYVEENGLKTVNDEGALRATIEQIIAENPKSVEDYKNGKEKAIGFLVGQTMKAMKGKADPGEVNKILKEELSK